MIRVLAVAAVIALSGCGGNAVREDPERMGFIMVSKGNASGIVRMFGGGVDYCKATQYNLEGIAFTGEIVYEEDTCRVEITASDQ